MATECIEKTEASSTSPISAKVLMKRRFRASTDSFQPNKRHYVSSALFGKNLRRSNQPPTSKDEYRLGSGDIQFPSVELAEYSNDAFDATIHSTLTSDLCSFQEATPVSKTKRFNHGIQAWLNKIQYYSKQCPFHKLRPERDHSFIDRNILTSPVEDLPEDAYTCYNQFRTQNFSDFFDTFKIQKANYSINNVDITAFPPLNELSYENLQDLRDQLFALPPFSAGSVNTISKEVTTSCKISEFLGEDGEETKQNETKATDTDSDSPKLEIQDFEAAQFPSSKLENIVEEEKSSKSEPKKASSPPPLNSTESEIESPTDSQVVISSIDQETPTSTPTPEIIRHLVNDTIESGDQFELDSTQFRQVDSLSVNEHVLTPIEHETLSMSSNSTYSPISVVVPALKQNHSIISDIAENLTGGQPIDPIYHPDDFYSQSAQEEDSDNFDIRDPQSYEISQENPSSSPTSPESPNTVESRIATIKFDKFAHLLLYDGSRRSRYSRVKNQLQSYNQSRLDSFEGIKRENLYKNRGSLSLSPTLSPNSLGKFRTRTLKLAKFSKFTTINACPSIDEIVECPNHDDILIPVRPILKSKHNKNADLESIRARYCDEVAVDDFMDFFENHEQQRLESEVYLERVRERQLMTYYSSEESSPTTNDTMFSD